VATSRVTAEPDVPFGEPCKGRTPGCQDPACSIIIGECHCSPDCHEKVPLATGNRTERGWRKGWPIRFTKAHAATLAWKARSRSCAERAAARSLRTVRQGSYGVVHLVIGTSCSGCGRELPIAAFEAGDPFCSRTCFEQHWGIEVPKRRARIMTNGSPPPDYQPTLTRRQLEALQRSEEVRRGLREGTGYAHGVDDSLSAEDLLLAAVLRMETDRPDLVAKMREEIRLERLELTA
jgi:hypothetical protein